MQYLPSEYRLAIILREKKKIKSNIYNSMCFNHITMNEQTLEIFLDQYISHTKVLSPNFVANRFCKEILLISSKDLMRKGISLETKKLRNDISKKFLGIFKKRNYRKEGNLHYSD